MKGVAGLRLLSAAVLALGICGCLAVPGAKNPASLGNYTEPSRLATLLSDRTEPYFLVDVRTAAEYTDGHIPTATNIPYDQIEAHPPTSDTAALVIVYCASGGRSAKAAASLAGLGYTRVVDFGGMFRWKGPLRKSTDPGECPCR